jgi:hypothetical protein
MTPTIALPIPELMAKLPTEILVMPFTAFPHPELGDTTRVPATATSAVGSTSEKATINVAVFMLEIDSVIVVTEVPFTVLRGGE